MIAIVCAALVAAVAAAQGPANPTPTYSGPGGRVALGAWTLREDPSDRGLALGWQRGGFSGSPVEVPSVVRPQAYTGRAGTLNYEGSVAWYRSSFTAPAAGRYALSFHSASYRAQVWLDGHSLGSHVGPYLPFELRATLAAGTHVVVVRVDWRNPGEQTGEGFHRTWFNWGGLNGAVEERPIGASELSSPTILSVLTPDAPDARQANVRVSVQVTNWGPARAITPEGALVHGQQSIALSFPTLTLAHGQIATVVANAEVPAPALWSPSAPNLYELHLNVGQESSYTARVGLRELSWPGGRLYLNGRRLLLHGASIQQDALAHGDALTPVDEARILAELKAIGANAVRSQHPLAESLLERFDAAGILVWQGVGPVEGAGNWFSSSPGLLAQAQAQARTGVIAEQLHPSVIAWNLVDEVAGNGHDGAEVSYVRSLTAWLHAHDPSRLVAVDVWGTHPPQRAGSLYAGVDAVAETDYSGWYDNPGASAGRLAAEMRSKLAAMERTFAGKVLAISEFGAESNGLNPPAAPGGYAYQARLLATHIDVYRADPRLSGMLIWLLRDYALTPTFQGGSIHSLLPRLKLIEGINQKGLFTRDGRAKPAVAAVARLFGELGP